MNSMVQIFLILVFLVIGTQTYTVGTQTYTVKQASFYSNDKKIQYMTNLLTHQKSFSKQKCKNDSSYSFMKIESSQAKYYGIIVCNIHARELIATEICLKWLDSVTQHGQITDKMNFTVFYRANNMRDYARTQQGQCVRKNKNGVDLNRNFPTEFNFYNQSSGSQIYPSDKPINQPFTICLNSKIEQHRPDFFLDIHSGETAFYYQQGLNNEKELSILNNINSSFPGLNLKKITTLKKDGQSINGHIFADMKVRKLVPYSFLFETYDGGIQKDNQGQKNCFKGFNPPTLNLMVSVRDVWSSAIMSTTKQVIDALESQGKQ